MIRPGIKNSTILLFLVLFSSNVSGQITDTVDDTLRKNAVKIFLDCHDCDMNYTRQEIPYINYVRDIHDAQVVILVSEQDAGSGGEQYTYTFHGQLDFRGMDDTLSYTSSPDQTSTIIRQKRTDLLKMGLMRYVARTPLFNEIEIRHNRELESEEVTDRWNYWVFELSTEPDYESEETQKQLDLRNSINISRITPDMKLEIEMDHFYQHEKFIENPNTDSVDISSYATSSASMQNLYVKSLGDHWSAGLIWALGSSTRENYRFVTEMLPSVEYDIFPYSEATHRQLRILYSAGYQYNKYNDSTIYNKVSENLFLHMLGIAFQVQKKWGSINISLTGSNYFHDFSKNRIEVGSFVNIRIFKGLSLRVSGDAAHINDQVNLKKGAISEAERLLRLRELATRYRLEGGIEITYTFGSIYNNVVNPRFGNGNGNDFD
ncbi:MAG: hypothetical protein A2V64_00165 [Bacteroidetes bacterium RBG_13_43_22]|nr:MAG: hypothetical protein A2V64_00165 [Bacteroidetes bacterium RBG_13_43_22]